MSDRKPGARREGAEQEGYHHPADQPPPPHFYHQSGPPPPPHMTTYANYPPRQQYASYPPYGAWQPGMRNDHLPSPPSDGFHPPYHRYPPRRNPTAVTPDQGHMVPPAEFMSPPSTVKKRPFASSSSLSPSKRIRKGKLSRAPYCHWRQSLGWRLLDCREMLFVRVCMVTSSKY